MENKPRSVINKTSRFLDSLGGTNAELSKRTGIKASQFRHFVNRDAIPAHFALVFLAECLAKKVPFQPSVFGFFKPHAGRIREGLIKSKSTGSSAMMTLGVIAQPERD